MGTARARMTTAAAAAAPAWAELRNYFVVDIKGRMV